MAAGNKRSNPALWRIVPHEKGGSPKKQIKSIRREYQKQTREDAFRYPPLRKVGLQQALAGVELDLYIRHRSVPGWFDFVEPYLASPADVSLFSYRAVDTCLFLIVGNSLFAVTSGFGYRVFDGFTDYGFPFDVAKKLVANNFTAADVRELAGRRAGLAEVFRRPTSMSNSDSLGKVWKRLIARIDVDQLPAGSFIGSIIDPKKPAAIEVKSSFTLRKNMSVADLAALARELDGLPAASPEQLKQLAFLDNLYLVRSTELADQLKAQLFEDLRRAARRRQDLDLDLADPDDIAGFQTGSSYKLSRWELDTDPPDIADVLSILREHCGDVLSDAESFAKKFGSMRLSYSKSDSDDAALVRREAWKFMHGQVDLGQETYFLLDTNWYQAKGDYLANLKRDFLDEVFAADDPIYLDDDIGLLEWTRGTEAEYNAMQAGEAGFYFGDEVFVVTERGPIELFDLLKVDTAARKLYLIHAKDGFGAKMRDACSQISVARELIVQDKRTGKAVLTEYYAAWSKSPLNAGVSADAFLGWFDLPIVYVILASTASEFVPANFGRTLNSHIARREILTTRNEFRAAGASFRLAHTKRKKP